MSTHHPDFERRIVQFTGYLNLMRHRAHEIVRGSCFIIFSSDSPEGDSEAILTVKREQTLSAVPAVSGFSCEQDKNGCGYLPDEGWRDHDSPRRFIQFSFEKSWFCLDMPLQILFRPEARQILRDRSGFFFLSQRPQFTLKGEDVEGFDPFRKIYIYDDDRCAAEDMAFIWFHVWRFPVSTRLYVQAAAFNGEHIWEERAPID